MRSGLRAVVVLSSCTLFAPFALAGGAGALVMAGPDGAPLSGETVIVKGRPYAVSAAAAADAGAAAPVAWKSEPSGVIAVADLGGGRAVLTALRDWFDESPGREPAARVTACAGTACVTAVFTCLPDVAGTWPTKLEVGGLFPGSEIRDLVFVQDGRTVTFDPEPANRPDVRRNATLRLEGNVLRLVKKGSILTRFDGALADRETGRGNWASSWGFSGIWTANRRR